MPRGLPGRGRGKRAGAVVSHEPPAGRPWVIVVRRMRAVVQRVVRAEARVDGGAVGAIGRGVAILLGVAAGDTGDDAGAPRGEDRPAPDLRARRPHRREPARRGGRGARRQPVHAARRHAQGQPPELLRGRAAGARAAALRALLRGAPRAGRPRRDGRLRREHGGRAGGRRPGDDRPRRAGRRPSGAARPPAGGRAAPVRAEAPLRRASRRCSPSTTRARGRSADHLLSFRHHISPAWRNGRGAPISF